MSFATCVLFKACTCFLFSNRESLFVAPEFFCFSFSFDFATSRLGLRLGVLVPFIDVVSVALVDFCGEALFAYDFKASNCFSSPEPKAHR